MVGPVGEEAQVSQTRQSLGVCGFRPGPKAWDAQGNRGPGVVTLEGRAAHGGAVAEAGLWGSAVAKG